MRATSADPRVGRSRAAALEAAAAIIAEEGHSAVTHQRVAERAGVGRATVYRHWPQLHDLLADTVATLDTPVFRPGGDPALRPWLHGELAYAATMFASPTVQHLIAAIIEFGGRDAVLASLRHAAGEHADAHLAARLRHAVAAGELPAAPDATDLAARLLGPLMFRALMQAQPIDDDFITTVIDHALAPT